MAGTDEVRCSPNGRRLFRWRPIVGAFAVGAVLLVPGQASAQPGTAPDESVPDDSVSVEPVTPTIDFGHDSAVTGMMDGLRDAVPGLDLGSLLPAPAAPGPAPAATPQTSTGERAVQAADSKIGAAYGYGATGPNAFDCSGLVQWAYGQAGVEVPRTSYEQLSAGTPVALADLAPGDVVSSEGGGHSALYAGDGKVVHAATSNTGVVMSDLSQMPINAVRRF